jgi:hypothetical protein
MSRRRPLTAAEAWQSWQVHSELCGGHTVAEALSFINDLEDVEERSRPLPDYVIPADCEPRWRTKLARWFGR